MKMKVDQHWKIQYIKNDEKYPLLLFDNWYTPDEETKVWTELDFYSSLPKEHTSRSEKGNVAKSEEGKPKGKSFRHSPYEIFAEGGLKYSSIVNTNYKFNTEEFHKIVEFCIPYNRSFHTHNTISTMVSYYEDGDYYGPHHDTSQWTFLCWFFKEPRKFDGGDVIMNEQNLRIGLKHNRALFFPSCFLHEVEPIKSKNNGKEVGFGRYAITHFFYHHNY